MNRKQNIPYPTSDPNQQQIDPQHTISFTTIGKSKPPTLLSHQIILQLEDNRIYFTFIYSAFIHHKIQRYQLLVQTKAGKHLLGRPNYYMTPISKNIYYMSPRSPAHHSKNKTRQIQEVQQNQTDPRTTPLYLSLCPSAVPFIHQNPAIKNGRLKHQSILWGTPDYHTTPRNLAGLPSPSQQSHIPLKTHLDPMVGWAKRHQQKRHI